MCFIPYLSAPFSFLINALSYFFSSGSEAFITLPHHHIKKPGEKITIKSITVDLKQGFLYILNNKGLRNLVFIYALQNFLILPIIVLLFFYVESILHSGGEWFGFLLATFSFGNIAGYIVAGLFILPGKYLCIPFFVVICLRSCFFSPGIVPFSYSYSVMYFFNRCVVWF